MQKGGQIKLSLLNKIKPLTVYRAKCCHIYAEAGEALSVVGVRKAVIVM